MLPIGGKRQVYVQFSEAPLCRPEVPVLGIDEHTIVVKQQVGKIRHPAWSPGKVAPGTGRRHY